MNNNTALQIRQTDDWSVIISQATVLVKTGFLPQAIKTPEQAAAIILTGRELGIGTMAALQTINVIQGKPTVSPQLMLALINRSGQLEDIQIETSIKGATVIIKRRGQSEYTAKFGPEEAKAMGLDGKDNYKKQPATMYKWRAVADACRAKFSDCILGLYTPDEMGAAVEPESGEVLEEIVEPKAIQAIIEVQADADTPQNRLMALFRELKMSQPQVRAFLKNSVGLDKPEMQIYKLVDNLLPNEANDVLARLQAELQA